MIVADASAIIQAVSDDSPAGRLLLDRLIDEQVHCPAHVDAEIGHAMRRIARANPLIAANAEAALHHAARLVTVRHEAPGALTTIAWSLRDRVSFYDALYVALAVATNSPLVTADERLARAALPCRVEVI